MDINHQRFYAQAMFNKPKDQLQSHIAYLVQLMCSERAKRTILLKGMSEEAQKALEEYNSVIEQLELEYEIATLVRDRK